MKLAYRHLWTLAAIVVFCGVSYATSPEQPKAIEVPFVYEQGQIYLPVKLSGLETTYRMMLNSGVRRSIVSYSVAKAAVIPTTVSNPNAANYDKNYSLQAIVRTMEIGDLKHGNLDVAIRASDGVAGVLGNDFLKHYVTQIDFRQRVVRFYQTSPFAKDLTSTDKMVVLKMKLDGREQVTIVEEVYVNSKKIKASLDTGFSGTLALTPEAVKHLGLKSVEDTKSKREARQIESLTVGTLKIDSPTALLYGKGSGFDLSLETLGSVIGNQFMDSYVVTFDYKNKLVVFQ